MDNFDKVFITMISSLVGKKKNDLKQLAAQKRLVFCDCNKLSGGRDYGTT